VLVAANLGFPGLLRAEVLNRIVLRVNDRIVTLHDYRDRLTEMQRAIQRGKLSPEEVERAMASAPADALRDLMDQALLMSRGDQMAVTVDEGDISRAEQDAKRNFGIDTDEEFAEALAQSGMTREQLHKQLREQLVTRQVLSREVHQAIKVGEEDMLRYYRDHPADFTTPARYKLQEVVVLDREGVAAAERDALAARIAERLAAGEKLAAIAEETKTAGATSGLIDLGWVTATDLDPALAAGVAVVEPGRTSAAIPGRGGLHILLVSEREPAKLRGYSEVKEELEYAERQRRFQGEFVKYMMKLERQAYVVGEPPVEAAGFRRAQEQSEELPAFSAPLASEPEKPATPPAAN
jgi:peptidyl-prolyl cis-trans isomerase SurA